MNKIQFDLELFEDDSTIEKLTIMSPLEVMWDDERNIIPDAYYKLIEQLSLGDKISITIEKKVEN